MLSAKSDNPNNPEKSSRKSKSSKTRSKNKASSLLLLHATVDCVFVASAMHPLDQADTYLRQAAEHAGEGLPADRYDQQQPHAVECRSEEVKEPVLQGWVEGTSRRTSAACLMRSHLAPVQWAQYYQLHSCR